MAYEPRDGDGSLFPNDYKTTDKHPDMRGSLKLGGVEYQISAWEKQGQRGQFLSLRVEPKRDRQQQQQQPPKQQQRPEPGAYASQPPDDEVPF